MGLILYNPDYPENVRKRLPHKLFEYVMAGLPILAPSLTAVSAIVEQYRIGRVARRLDLVSFGEEIGAMANDTEALAELRCNALAVAHGPLNWESER